MMVLTSTEITNAKTALKQNMETNWTHMGYGSGTTSAQTSDTGLETEIDRVARQETSSNTDSKTISAFIPTTMGNGNDITETGFFDAETGGNLLNRTTFPSISKTDDIELWVDSTVTFDVTQE